MKHVIPTVTIILLCALLTPSGAAQMRKQTPTKNPAPAQAHRGVQKPPSLAFFKGEWQMERNSFTKSQAQELRIIVGTNDDISIEQSADGGTIQFKLREGSDRYELGTIPLTQPSTTHRYQFILKFNKSSGKYLLSVKTEMGAARDNMAFENLPLRYVTKDKQLVGEGKGTIGLVAVTVKAVIKLGEPANGHSWLVTGHDSSGAEKDKYDIKFSPKKG